MERTEYTGKRNLEHAYVLAQSTHYGHDLSFKKYSNLPFSSALHFSNGGISVDLLRMDGTRVSKTKQTLNAYQQMALIGTGKKSKRETV